MEFVYEFRVDQGKLHTCGFYIPNVCGTRRRHRCDKPFAKTGFFTETEAFIERRTKNSGEYEESKEASKLPP